MWDEFSVKRGLIEREVGRLGGGGHELLAGKGEVEKSEVARDYLITEG